VIYLSLVDNLQFWRTTLFLPLQHFTISTTDMSDDTAAQHGTATAEKPGTTYSSREVASSNGSSTAKIPARNIAFQPPSRHQTRHSLELDDYFAGPRDMQKHSKLPLFMRVHGSVMPKMILPLTFVGAWATAITCISKFVYKLGKYHSVPTYQGMS